ncbi:MAG: hypothetical protein AB7N76_21505 [Planctomycetota bacterium]
MRQPLRRDPEDQPDDDARFRPPGWAAQPEAPPPPEGVLALLHQQALDWCRDRSWEVRLPVLLFFAYVLVRHLAQLEYGSFVFNGINLGFHEMGHVVFRPFGELLMIAGGTILQCLVPIVAAVGFYLSQKDFFAVAFCMGWFATNCFNCSVYAMDAQGRLNLPLVSPWGQGFGADGMGDWTRMLSKLGKLHWDSKIAFAWKSLGVISMLGCFLFGGWLLWQMHLARSAPPPEKPSWA